MPEGRQNPIEKQKIPPFLRIASIAFSGIKVRLARMMITMGGICLALAYVASIRVVGLVTDNIAKLSRSASCYDASGNWLGTDAAYAPELGVERESVDAWRAELLEESERRLWSEAASGARERGKPPPSLEDLRSGSWRDGSFTVDVFINTAGKETRDAYLKETLSRSDPSVLSRSEKWRARWLVGLPREEKTKLVSRMPPEAQRRLEEMKAARAAEFEASVGRNSRIVAEDLEEALMNDGLVADLTDPERLRRQRAASWWVMGVVLVVAMAGIFNAMLMAVTERFREIGTMKCLGAMDGLILLMFLLESAVLGLVGATVGIAGGLLLSALQLWRQYDWAAFVVVPWGDVCAELVKLFFCGLFLTVVGALGPAYQAARMAPVAAMQVDQ